jgi:hypothetical protein
VGVARWSSISELARNAGLYSDLRSIWIPVESRDSSGARLLEPDLSPDERTVVAPAVAGRRALGVDAAPPQVEVTIVSKADTHNPPGRLTGGSSPLNAIGLAPAPKLSSSIPRSGPLPWWHHSPTLGW